MKKKIFILLISLFAITGCNNKEEDKSKSLDSFKCFYEVSNTNVGYTSSSEYTVYYEGEYVDNVDIVETITADSSDVLDSIKQSIKDMYDPLKEKYKGYSYKITRDNKKMISKVNIDYNKMDITAYLRDNPGQEEYFLGDKLTIDGILEIYNSMQIGCDYNPALEFLA